MHKEPSFALESRVRIDAADGRVFEVKGVAMLREIEEDSGQSLMGQSYMENVEENLKKRREQTRQNLVDLDKAIELLQKQPELLETLNVLKRVGI